MADKQVKRKTSIGGQALIEGVMMRGPQRTALAVRHTSGEIRTDSWETSGSNRPKILKLPFIRGVFNFADSMIFGYRCMMKSVEMSGMEEEITGPAPAPVSAVTDTAAADPDAVTVPEPETVTGAPTGAPADHASVIEEPAARTGEEPAPAAVDAAPDAAAPSSSDASAGGDASSGASAKAPKEESYVSKAAMSILMVVSVILGVGLAVVLFMWLPVTLGGLMSRPFPIFSDNRLLRAAFEGVIRIVLFVAYIVLVSLMKDIRRVFMYHGAEHKTIFCYEKEMELTVDNVRRQSRFHPRCGTSFIIFMLLIGIVISMFIPASLNAVLRTAIKLLTIPLVVGIGYEMIKLAGRSDNIIVRILSAPGLWLQRVTTREPTDDMIEVAITSFKMVAPEEPGADSL